MFRTLLPSHQRAEKVVQKSTALASCGGFSADYDEMLPIYGVVRIGSHPWCAKSENDRKGASSDGCSCVITNNNRKNNPNTTTISAKSKLRQYKSLTAQTAENG